MAWHDKAGLGKARGEAGSDAGLSCVYSMTISPKNAAPWSSGKPNCGRGWPGIMWWRCRSGGRIRENRNDLFPGHTDKHHVVSGYSVIKSLENSRRTTAMRPAEFSDALSRFTTGMNGVVPLMNWIEMGKPLTPSALCMVGQNHEAVSCSSNRSACMPRHSIAIKTHPHAFRASLCVVLLDHRTLAAAWFRCRLRSMS